jgi:hypothetical protein
MTYLPTSSLLNSSLYGNALTSYNPTTANLLSYGLGSPSLSSLGLTGSSSLSALSGLYGSDYSSLYVNYNKDQQIALLTRELEKYKNAAENRTGFLGFPILGANKENGNGGFDTGTGFVSALATIFLPKLFKDGGLSKLFGGSSS